MCPGVGFRSAPIEHSVFAIVLMLAVHLVDARITWEMELCTTCWGYLDCVTLSGKSPWDPGR